LKGTGIGLSMVDHIVRAHHGRVHLEGRTLGVTLIVAQSASRDTGHKSRDFLR
jgi:signal transduction histidine kinase